jgi:hypothetical protein
MNVRGRALDLGFAALIAAQLGASAWLVPVGDHVALPSGASLGGLCWFRAAFALDCPFCGMTRSFVALAHGDIASAFRFHAAGPLLFVAMALALAAFVWTVVRRRPPLAERREFLVAAETITALSLVIGVFQMVRS